MRRASPRRASGAALVCAGVVVTLVTGCGGQASAADRAVEALVAGRGMDPAVARCAVDELQARGVDPEVVGDGRVVVEEHPEVIEAVAVCAAALASDGPEPT